MNKSFKWMLLALVCAGLAFIGRATLIERVRAEAEQRAQQFAADNNVEFTYESLTVGGFPLPSFGVFNKPSITYQAEAGAVLKAELRDGTIRLHKDQTIDMNMGELAVQVDMPGAEESLVWMSLKGDAAIQTRLMDLDGILMVDTLSVKGSNLELRAKDQEPAVLQQIDLAVGRSEERHWDITFSGHSDNNPSFSVKNNEFLRQAMQRHWDESFPKIHVGFTGNGFVDLTSDGMTGEIAMQANAKYPSEQVVQTDDWKLSLLASDAQDEMSLVLKGASEFSYGQSWRNRVGVFIEHLLTDKAMFKEAIKQQEGTEQIPPFIIDGVLDRLATQAPDWARFVDGLMPTNGLKTTADMTLFYQPSSGKVGVQVRDLSVGSDRAQLTLHAAGLINEGVQAQVVLNGYNALQVIEGGVATGTELGGLLRQLAPGEAADIVELYTSMLPHLKPAMIVFADKLAELDDDAVTVNMTILPTGVLIGEIPLKLIPIVWYDALAVASEMDAPAV